jgi:hypothetical protein
MGSVPIYESNNLLPHLAQSALIPIDFQYQQPPKLLRRVTVGSIWHVVSGDWEKRRRRRRRFNGWDWTGWDGIGWDWISGCSS